MTEQELNEIRAREQKATPGPWEFRKYGRYEDHDECAIELSDDTIELTRYENGDFVAHAREDVPRLLDEVERLQKELDAAKHDLCSTFGAPFETIADLSMCDICAHKSADGSCDRQCFANSLGARNRWE